MLHYVTMKTDVIIRMRLSTFRKLKYEFPADRDESVDKYFKRLAEILKLNSRRITND